MNKNCKEIVELLVDYADGDLTASEAAIVSEHLASCPLCRELLDGLRKSLVIAGDIWNDNLRQMEAISARAASRRATWVRYGLIAASVAVAAIAFICWQSADRQQHRIYTNSKTNTTISMSTITQQIEDAGRAAELLAAADLLRTSPTAHKIAENQYRYIVEQYPETEAAAQAKTYLAQIKKGDT